VRGRITTAAALAGRDPAELTLIAIGKTWPASDVAALVGLGVGDVGENRDQEARPKAAEVDRLLAAGLARPTWHFVGRLQRNKARSVSSWADWVHSVDRPVLVGPLDAGARDCGRILTVCVQVSLDSPAGDDSRGGAAMADVARVADLVAGAGNLRLAGVMAVAPRGSPARPAFARLRDLSVALRRDHPSATVVSAGMSGDLADAVAEGATHLRVGTALFGQRPRFP
jgi:PLP dependent protein